MTSSKEQLKTVSSWVSNLKVFSFLLFCAYALSALIMAGIFRGWDVAITGDGSGHYVSAMMFEDYFFHNTTLNFFDHIVNFHYHHPAVSVGLWPPLFHLVIAFWSGVTSNSIFSMLVLDALVVGGTGMLAYVTAKRVLSLEMSVIAGFLTCFVPEYLATSIVLKIDVFTGALVFASALLFSDLWARPTWSRAFATIVVTVAALLSKGTGMALVLIFAMIALSHFKFERLKDAKIWTLVLAVGVLAGPWYLATSAYSSQGFRFEPGIDYSVLALMTYGGYVLDNLTVVGLLLAPIGVWYGLKSGQEGVKRASVVLLCVVFGAFLFQVLMPVALQSRYITAIYIALGIFIVMGVNAIAQKFSINHSLMGALAAILMLGYSATVAQPLPRAPTEAAQMMLDVRSNESLPILMLTSFHYGGLINIEVLKALPSDERSSIALIRGFKLLGGGGYNASDYEPKYATSAEVLEALVESGLKYMLLEKLAAKEDMITHNRQFLELVEQYPEYFEVTGSIDTQFDSQLILYKFTRNDAVAINTRLLTETNSNRAYDAFQQRIGNP